MKKVILILMIFIFVSLAFAITQVTTIFSNGLSQENITLVGGVNVTREINIYSSAYINNFSINVTTNNQLNFSECYQNQVDVATYCGGRGTGVFSGTSTGSLIDGNFATIETTPYADIHINYTKPSNATPYLNMSYWYVRDGNGYKRLYPTSTCWDYSNETLALRYYYNSDAPAKWARWYCYGSGWETLNQSSTGSGQGYDEAMMWNYSKDVDIYLNNQYKYSLDATVNRTQTLFFNVTPLNDLLASQTCSSATCDYPIKFVTPPNGSISYNDIDLDYSYGVDNCSNSYGISSNSTMLNVSFYDINKNLLPIDYEVTFDYGVANSSQASFSMAEYSQDSFEMCIYPSYAFVYSDFLIFYNNMTYYDSSILNGSNKIYINITVQTETYPVTFTVQDYDDNIIEFATIKILRWDISTNSYTTTEILQTDNLGQAVGQIELGTTFYKFIIEYNSQVYLTFPETQGIRQYADERLFRIDLGNTQWFDNYLDLLQVANDVYYNNVTNSFHFTYTDLSNTVEEGCLLISKRNQSGETTLSDSCVSSVAADLIYTITPSNFTTFIGTGYFNYNGETYVGDTETVYFAGDLSMPSSDNFGVLLALALIVVLTLLGVEHPFLSYIGFGIGLIASSILQWWVISLGAIVGIMIVGGIHLRRFNNK